MKSGAKAVSDKLLKKGVNDEDKLKQFYEYKKMDGDQSYQSKGANNVQTQNDENELAEETPVALLPLDVEDTYNEINLLDLSSDQKQMNSLTSYKNGPNGQNIYATDKQTVDAVAEELNNMMLGVDNEGDFDAELAVMQIDNNL